MKWTISSASATPGGLVVSLSLLGEAGDPVATGSTTTQVLVPLSAAAANALGVIAACNAAVAGILASQTASLANQTALTGVTALAPTFAGLTASVAHS